MTKATDDQSAHLQQRPLPVREGAAEALQSLDAMVPAHLRSSRHGENFMGQHYEKVRAALLSPSLPVREEPTGWKLVPVEPTKEMVEAAKDERMRCFAGDDYGRQPLLVGTALTNIYRAMLASSPSVQNMGEGETGKDGVEEDLNG